MKWTLLLLAVCVTGCCCQPSGRTPVDPFYGRTTVPPPPTGAIPGQPGAQYYQPPVQASPAPLQPIPQTNPGVSQPYPSGGGATPYPAAGANVVRPGSFGNGNWTSPDSHTGTAWTSPAGGQPGDVITIPVAAYRN